MKHADKLFGVFQRLHRSEDFEGTGVGLATVQRIIKKHQGRDLGRGRTGQGRDLLFHPGRLQPLRRKRSHGTVGAQSMNSDEIDILLVEDSPDDAELAIHALRREHLANNIFIARDGEEALDFLFCRGPFAARSFEHPPKLVLLDLKLPKVDGIEVLRQIKQDPRTKAIPVVVLTSSKRRTRSGAQLRSGGQQLHPEARGLRKVSGDGENGGSVLDGHQPASRRRMTPEPSAARGIEVNTTAVRDRPRTGALERSPSLESASCWWKTILPIAT